MTETPHRYRSLDDIRLVPSSGVPLIQQSRTQYARLITSGQLRTGTLLPAVRTLAEQLGVNVNTVRIAYQRLAEDGLVATSHGVGTRVLPLDPAQLVQLAAAERTNAVGIIVPDMGNPFYASFLQGVEKVARENETMLLVYSTHDDPHQLLRAVAQFSARHVDGLIAASCNLCKLIPEQSKPLARLPVVHADSPACTHYSVQMDLENAGYQATQHLIEHGHRDIGLVTHIGDFANVRPVNRGYERALEEARIDFDPDLITRVDGFDMQAGRLGAQALLSSPKRPTAIFAIADMLALGVMEAVRTAGLRIPHDIALTSFNNIAFAALVAPALTSVAAPAHDLGQESMKMLNSLMGGKQPPRQRVMLPTSLIIRESCGPHGAASI